MPNLSSLIENPGCRAHFVGLGGTGMSALAQFRALGGGCVSGSDRDFDRGALAVERAQLEALGIEVVPQDGRGVEGADFVVASTAVESDIPDVARARDAGLPILHRAELLAHHLAGPSVAIAGTSGKSTVTAMTFELLQAAGDDPGLITGGRLTRLMADGSLGNAHVGRGPVVAEADESDGSLIRHAPEVGVLLNLHRDHMELEDALLQFRTFRERTRGPFVVSDDEGLRELRPGALVFGFGEKAELRGRDLRLGHDDSHFTVDGHSVRVPLPGAHNAFNALAALAACRALDVDLELAAAAIAGYGGVHRRFERIGQADGVEVFDDFAHNPDKLRAALGTAARRSKRVLAYFQPHGFGPTRFLRDGLVAAFADVLREHDRLWIGDIYYAGGTVAPTATDISAADLVNDLRARGAPVEHATSRAQLADAIAHQAKPGDTVLVLGARDPTLPALARELLDAIRRTDLEERRQRS